MGKSSKNSEVSDIIEGTYHYTCDMYKETN